MRRWLQQLATTLPWTLAPGTCVLCGFPSHRRQDLCAVCKADLRSLPDPCPRCGLPRPAGAATTDSCGACQRHPPRYGRLVAACSYTDPADLLVRALKFRKVRAAARVMAEIMWARRPADAFSEEAWLLPVPLHPWRQWRRGFNQSTLIANHLARLGPWRVLAGAAGRRRRTRAQSGLSRADRRRNLANAFRVKPGQLPPSIVLIDDVVTTGTTLDALALTLRRAGVRDIRAWVFARTPPR